MRQGMTDYSWLVLTSLVAISGCWNGPAPPAAAPMRPAAKPTMAPKTLLAAKGLFFADREPKPADQPLPISLAALKRHWVAFLPSRGEGDDVWLSDLITVSFADKMPTDFVAPITIAETQGTAQLIIDGSRFGLLSTTLAWGAASKADHVWMSNLGAHAPTMEVSLVREDLLRVTGAVLLPGGLDAQLDLLLINIPAPIPHDASLPAPELKDVASDKMVQADSIEPYLGQWVAELPDGKFTLEFTEHRVLKLVIEPADGARQTVFYLLRFNPAGKYMQLQILNKSYSALPIKADLRLTESGKLHWLWLNYNEARGFVFQRSDRQME